MATQSHWQAARTSVYFFLLQTKSNRIGRCASGLFLEALSLSRDAFASGLCLGRDSARCVDCEATPCTQSPLPLPLVTPMTTSNPAPVPWSIFGIQYAVYIWASTLPMVQSACCDPLRTFTGTGFTVHRKFPVFASCVRRQSGSQKACSLHWQQGLRSVADYVNETGGILHTCRQGKFANIANILVVRSTHAGPLGFSHVQLV